MRTVNQSKYEADNLYRYIRDYIALCGMAPSIEQLANEFAQSEVWIMNRTNNLINRGLVTGRGRNLKLCSELRNADTQRWLTVYQRKDEIELLEAILARLEAHKERS